MLVNPRQPRGHKQDLTWYLFTTLYPSFVHNNMHSQICLWWKSSKQIWIHVLAHKPNGKQLTVAPFFLCSQTTLIYLSMDNTLSFASVLCSQWNTHIHFYPVHLTRLFMPSTQFPWHYRLCIYVVYISTSCIGVAQCHFSALIQGSFQPYSVQ